MRPPARRTRLQHAIAIDRDIDWALHGWILSWGPHVHVAAPSALAQEILAMLDGARELYVPKLNFDQAFSAASSTASRSLPLLESKSPGKRRNASPS